MHTTSTCSSSVRITTNRSRPSANRLRPLRDEPLGFFAGDSNLRRFVGNDPTNATDASGLQEKKADPVSKTPQSDKVVYQDEVLYGGRLFRKSESFRNAINQLIELRDKANKEGSLITLNIYYAISAGDVGEAGTAATHAVVNAKAEGISISYYTSRGEE